MIHYTSVQAQNLTGLTRRQIGLLISGGLLTPSVHQSQAHGDWHRFSLHDLCCLQVIALFRKEGIAQPLLHRIMVYLRPFELAMWEHAYLTYDGKNPCLQDEKGLIDFWQHPTNSNFMWVVSLSNIEKYVRERVTQLSGLRSVHEFRRGKPMNEATRQKIKEAWERRKQEGRNIVHLPGPGETPKYFLQKPTNAERILAVMASHGWGTILPFTVHRWANCYAQEVGLNKMVLYRNLKAMIYQGMITEAPTPPAEETAS